VDCGQAARAVQPDLYLLKIANPVDRLPGFEFHGRVTVQKIIDSRGADGNEPW
jgi:hypothetical protein